MTADRPGQGNSPVSINPYAIRRDEWPWWASMIALKSMPEDKGIGDVCARIIGPETSEAFKAFYLMTFGKPCGCEGRQARWNRMYPLNEHR